MECKTAQSGKKMKTYLFQKATKICNNEKFLIQINVSS